ncbi:hypothetical protein [Roseiconus lacunae]|uniref:Leucine Rich repeats (2 copies) n=1 Tax=Roseiconus lacunae TaxID=2605694 RepID=A0ABT7PDT4_9BACT|nr:hypothetical protein [Roseiconus lacunae]MDM4014662.1 hypothetical protein [Roseiconus lacunae]
MKRFRFSLRGLLALAVIVAIVSVVHKQRREVHAVVRYIEKLGGRVEYRSGFLDRFHERTNHYFATPVTVRLARSSVAGGDLQTIGKLTSLERLYLERTKIRSEDLQYLVPCRKLQRLSIWGNRNITAKALGYLKELPDLRLLDIHSTLIDVDRIAECGDFPALEKLIFSPRFMSGKFGLGEEDLNKLLRIPVLEPVGPCYFQQADSRSLNHFLRHDFYRVREIHFRDCDLDTAGLEKLNQMLMFRLDFQFCKINAEELHSLDHRPNRELRFYLPFDVSDDDRLTLADFCDWLPGHVQSMTVRDNEVVFTFAGLRPVRIRWKNSLSERLDIHKVINNGCDSIVFDSSEPLEDYLRACVMLGFSRSLRVPASSMTWRYVPRLTRLQRLTIARRDVTPLQFSSQMTLNSLTVTGTVPLSESDWNSIGQLRDLEYLSIHGGKSYSANDIAVLAEMPNLREVFIRGLTTEAIAFLSSHGIRTRTYIGGRM